MSSAIVHDLGALGFRWSLSDAGTSFSASTGTDPIVGMGLGSVEEDIRKAIVRETVQFVLRRYLSRTTQRLTLLGALAIVSTSTCPSSES